MAAHSDENLQSAQVVEPWNDIVTIGSIRLRRDTMKGMDQGERGIKHEATEEPNQPAKPKTNSGRRPNWKTFPQKPTVIMDRHRGGTIATVLEHRRRTLAWCHLYQSSSCSTMHVFACYCLYFRLLSSSLSFFLSSYLSLSLSAIQDFQDIVDLPASKLHWEGKAAGLNFQRPIVPRTR